MGTSKVKLTTSISRRYGAITTSWGMECEVEVSSRSDILREYNRMHDHIRAEMIDFESATLPRLPAPKVPEAAPEGLPEAAPQKDEKIGWHPLEMIYTEVKKGQSFYYAKTSSGPFMRHGAPLYWDNFTGLNKDTFEGNSEKGVLAFDPMFHRVRIVKRGDKYYAQALSNKDKVS